MGLLNPTLEFHVTSATELDLCDELSFTQLCYFQCQCHMSGTHWSKRSCSLQYICEKFHKKSKECIFM
jgi:hypothetical protein